MPTVHAQNQPIQGLYEPIEKPFKTSVSGDQKTLKILGVDRAEPNKIWVSRAGKDFSISLRNASSYNHLTRSQDILEAVRDGVATLSECGNKTGDSVLIAEDAPQYKAARSLAFDAQIEQMQTGLEKRNTVNVDSRLVGQLEALAISDSQTITRPQTSAAKKLAANLDAGEVAQRCAVAEKWLAYCELSIDGNADELPAIYHAMKCYDDRVLEGLILLSADPNAQDDWGRTPLHIAVEEGNADAVNTLVAAGAHIDVKDHAGNTPAHVAAKKYRFQLCHMNKRLCYYPVRVAKSAHLSSSLWRGLLSFA